MFTFIRLHSVLENGTETLSLPSGIIVSHEMARKVMDFRALAIAYPRVREKVRVMDEFRAGVILDLYEAMG